MCYLKNLPLHLSLVFVYFKGINYRGPEILADHVYTSFGSVMPQQEHAHTTILDGALHLMP